MLPHLFHSSIQGESHIRRQESKENLNNSSSYPCQDYSAAEELAIKTKDKNGAEVNIEVNFLCVCDGHGGDEYFRSKTGAEFAALALKELLEANIEEFTTLMKEGKEGKKESYDKIKQKLSIGLIKRWKEKVDNDLSTNPITEEELATLSKTKPEVAKEYEAGKDRYSIYGTTLISYFQTRDFWYAIQIGDGDLAIYSDKNTYMMPIPEDENCFLNQTTSLCDTNAKNEFRVAYGIQNSKSANKPKFVILTSDGVGNSFLSKADLCTKFYSTLYNLLNSDKYDECKECKKIKCSVKCREDLFDKEVKAYLPILSKKGSGDDLSVALLCNVDNNLTHIKETQEQGKVNV